MTSWVDICDIIYVFFCPSEKCPHSPVGSGFTAEGERGTRLGSSVCEERYQPGKVWTLFFFFWLICFDIKVEHSQKPHSTFLLPSSDTLHLLPGLASSGGRDFRSWRASSPTWRRSFSSSQRCWNSKSPRFRKLASSCRKYRWVVFYFYFIWWLALYACSMQCIAVFIPKMMM